jgi:hypothetical protein
VPSGERDCCPFPRTPFLAPSRLPPLRSGPSGTSRFLDQAEHFLHNQKASVATLRLLFGTGPESCSASLRNAVRLRRNAHYSHKYEALLTGAEQASQVKIY